MGNELAVIETANFPVLQPGAAAELAGVIAENFGEDGLTPSDLDRINIPAGGGTAWEVPSLTGAEMEKTIKGIILFWQSPRKYWVKGVDEMEGGETTPPDCSSDDSKIGFGLYGVGSELHPTGDCMTCPMNQWGTAGEDRKGKACREGRLLFLLREGDTLPVAVDLPPTSIGPLRKYMLRLANQVKIYNTVVTELALQGEQKGAMKWSTVIPTLVGELPAAAVPVIAEFAASLKDAVTRNRAAEIANGPIGQAAAGNGSAPIDTTATPTPPASAPPPTAATEPEKTKTAK